jgi:hypothetical protein
MPFFLFENMKKAEEDQAKTKSHSHVYHRICTKLEEPTSCKIKKNQSFQVSWDTY